MRCNLSCIGCYAGNYSKSDDMDYELFDRIISEAETMGVVFFTILGGEPLVLKEDLFRVAKKHSKAYFQFYTNGTLINQEVVDSLKKLGNLLPVISIEGYEKETDYRRGKGIYNKIMKAMDLLKENKVPFGYSVAITNKNAKIVSSDKFVDFMIEKGAFIGWHFLYMPIGSKPDLKLMSTPEQRRMLRDRWIHIRKTKPIFIVDFWNDAPFVGGCIAGKEYVHITSKGDVEPCIFTHFAVDNIKNKPLIDVMKSDFFKELRKRQPYSENLYLPCMWIDHPEVSQEIIKKFNAYPTHPGAEDILKDKKLKAGVKKYSKEVKKLFDPVWKSEKNIYCS
jgi:MoaA/NifB/PqqE/SkfB family radical SAM enzyme